MSLENIYNPTLMPQWDSTLFSCRIYSKGLIHGTKNKNSMHILMQPFLYKLWLWIELKEWLSQMSEEACIKISKKTYTT